MALTYYSQTKEKAWHHPFKAIYTYSSIVLVPYQSCLLLSRQYCHFIVLLKHKDGIPVCRLFLYNRLVPIGSTM